MVTLVVYGAMFWPDELKWFFCCGVLILIGNLRTSRAEKQQFLTDFRKEHYNACSDVDNFGRDIKAELTPDEERRGHNNPSLYFAPVPLVSGDSFLRRRYLLARQISNLLSRAQSCSDLVSYKQPLEEILSSLRSIPANINTLLRKKPDASIAAAGFPIEYPGHLVQLAEAELERSTAKNGSANSAKDEARRRLRAQI